MPDLLTHVLVAYSLGTVLSWRLSALDTQHVAIVMVGTVIPDLAKIRLLIGGDQVASAIGVPFAWFPLHRLGGAVLVAGVVVYWFHARERRLILGLLLVGIGLHLPLDALIMRANGVSPPYLYPLTWWHPPAGMLYLSSDVWPSLAALGAAAVIWGVDKRR